MDVISYNIGATANERIERFNTNPDSDSGLVSLPKKISEGESVTIPEGRVVVHPSLEIDGTLTIEDGGELFIPYGGTLVSSDLVHPVDTIADLRNATGKYKYVYVTGYHSKNDGAFGSHFFRLKGVKTTETDNGGTVIIATIGGVDYVYELQYNGSLTLSMFGARAGVDSTNEIKEAIKYMQNGNLFIYNQSYTQAQISAAVDAAYNTNVAKSLEIDNAYTFSEPLVITGGFEIKTRNNYGAWGNEHNGLFYTGSEDIAIMSALFFKNAPNDFQIVRTKSKLDSLIADSNIDNLPSNVTNYTRDMTIEFNLGAANSKIGMLMSGRTSYMKNCKIGLLFANPDIALVLINTWKTVVENSHLYGKRQSLAAFKVNSSASLYDVYCTTIGTDGVDFRPEVSQIIGVDDVVMVYTKASDIGMNEIVTEAGLDFINGCHHIVADYNSKVTINGLYQESHNMPHFTDAGVSAYQDSAFIINGGFIDKSNSAGYTLYLEDVSSEYPSSCNADISRWGGALIGTYNSSARIKIGLNGQTRDITKYGALKANLSLLDIEGSTPTQINVDENLTVVRTGSAKTIEDAIILCNIHGINKISLSTNITATADIDLSNFKAAELIIDINGKVLSMGTFRFNVGDNKYVRHIRFDGVGKISKTGSYLVHAGGQSRLDVTLTGLSLSGNFWIWGNYRDAMTKSVINLQECTYDSFSGSAIAGTPASAKSIDAITVFVNNKTRAEVAALVTDTPIKFMPNGVLYAKDDK